MPFDGVRADEQLRTDLLVRQPVAGQPRDLCLLCRQFSPELTGCLRTFSPVLRTHSGEYLMGVDELSTRIVRRLTRRSHSP